MIPTATATETSSPFMDFAKKQAKATHQRTGKAFKGTQETFEAFKQFREEMQKKQRI